MESSLTRESPLWQRGLAFLAGIGMVAASFLTVQHFFDANYPETIWEGSFCDVSAFFNCDSSAFSTISAIGGVPIGFFGMLIGALAALGVVFPSNRFERTNQSLALLNIMGVVGLLLYSIFVLGSVCLLCSGYYFFSGVHFFLYWKYGLGHNESLVSRFLRPSIKILVVFGIITLTGATGVFQYHQVRKEAQTGGVASKVVAQYMELPEVPLPSTLSPFWTARATENFEDAPIRIVEYADLLCSDCLLLHKQLTRLKEEFNGKMNIAFQLFPLEGKCNDVVEKDLHPGACDLSLMVAYDSSKFKTIHDEIYDNFQRAKTSSEWRKELAARFDVEPALTDSATASLLDRLIATGAEYERTSDKYAHGIRSTPTMIINNRMIIGTFPDAQMRAIFQALLEQAEGTESGQFMENWVD